MTQAGTRAGRGVLIVGGYGHVGQRAAHHLIAAGLGPIRIVGRNGTRASALGKDLGCEGRAMDLTDPASWRAALEGMGTVLVCIDLPRADFAANVLRQGVDYVDISATDAVLRRIEALDQVACQHGARAVLSVGLAPGLTNLLAKAAVRDMASVDRVVIGVLLGLGDAHGTAAIDWTLNNLRPLSPAEIHPMAFGQLPQRHPTIPFDFADQHVLRRQYGWPVETRLGFASALVTGISLRLLAGLARRPWFRRTLKASMTRFRLGSDRAALAIEAHGHDVAGQPLYRRLCLEGRAEADITALVAARVITLLSPDLAAGVHHIERIWEIEDFAPRLAAAGATLFGLPPSDEQT